MNDPRINHQRHDTSTSSPYDYDEINTDDDDFLEGSGDLIDRSDPIYQTNFSEIFVPEVIKPSEVFGIFNYGVRRDFHENFQRQKFHVGLEKIY